MEPLGWALSWLSPARCGLLSRTSEDRGDSAGSELGLHSRLAPPTRGAVEASRAQGRGEHQGMSPHRGGQPLSAWGPQCLSGPAVASPHRPHRHFAEDCGLPRRAETAVAGPLPTVGMTALQAPGEATTLGSPQPQCRDEETEVPRGQANSPQSLSKAGPSPGQVCPGGLLLPLRAATRSGSHGTRDAQNLSRQPPTELTAPSHEDTPPSTPPCPQAAFGALGSAGIRRGQEWA